MSLRRMLDRRVTIVPRVEGTPDARGNIPRTDGTPIEDVPAARDLLDVSEDLAGSDQQARTFRYFLPASVDGDPLQVTGYDRIEDGDEVFEVRGTPEEFHRRRRAVRHHLEVIAYRIAG